VGLIFYDYQDFHDYHDYWCWLVFLAMPDLIKKEAVFCPLFDRFYILCKPPTVPRTISRKPSKASETPQEAAESPQRRFDVVVGCLYPKRKRAPLWGAEAFLF
jgi:hypothetical protein